MTLIHALLPGFQVIVSILLVTAILLQQRGAGLGGAFGDSTQGTFYTRRGAELFLFRASIVLAILFALSALLALIIS
jgi:preprotein translocase subunit SecG